MIIDEPADEDDNEYGCVIKNEPTGEMKTNKSSTKKKHWETQRKNAREKSVARTTHLLVAENCQPMSQNKINK